MNDSVIEVSDLAYRRRIQALQGVDDLVNDIVTLLEEKGILDETYSECDDRMGVAVLYH